MNARPFLLGFLLAWAPCAATAQELRKFTADDGLPGDRFGTALTVDGDILVVGAPARDFETGTAYAFDLATGLQTFQFAASDVKFGDSFGWQVAVAPSAFVVSSPDDTDIQGVTVGVGSLSLFDRATGADLGKIWASDRETNDHLGYSLAVDGDLVAAGAIGDKVGGVQSGSVYLFDLATGSETKLVPSDGATFDHFGNAVAMGAGYVAVGAAWADRAGPESGSVYVFDAATATELYQLQPFGQLEREYFGWDVAMDGTRLVVSSAGAKISRAPFPSHTTTPVYVYDVVTGQLLVQLDTWEGPKDGVGLGHLAIDGDRVLVGMPLANEPNIWSGATYLFDSWTGAGVQKVLPSDPAKYEYFGSSVGLHPEYMLIGADADLQSQGSVYLFARR